MINKNFLTVVVVLLTISDSIIGFFFLDVFLQFTETAIFLIPLTFLIVYYQDRAITRYEDEG